MIGKTISHYRILDKLGEGGMGVVYRAEDTRLGRTVALKFLPPELTRDSAAKTRFMREARAAAALDHPNICNIHEIDETPDERLFISMACYEGETLKEKIARGPLKIREAIDAAVRVATGLAAAHGGGIIHRDIKPGNIFLLGDGQVKVMDFGLARSQEETRLTVAGSTVGTVAYMSPEQARGEQADHRTDIWSLGAVLYEMITGRLPFRGEREAAIVHAILNEDPEPPTALRTGVPMELERVVQRCLERKPGDRYQTAADLVSDLNRVRRATAESDAALVTAARSTGSRTRRAGIRNTRGQMTSPEAAAPGARPFRRFPRWSLAIPAAVLVTVALLILRSQLRPDAETTPERTPVSASQTPADRCMLVVLPFENLGPAENAYFADGMTEEITSRLAAVRALGVISRTTATQYDRTGKTLGQIGEDLGVDYVLEGTVRWDGTVTGESRVRVTPQLIRVTDDTHVWADVYERKLADVFLVQSDIAEKVVGQLGITLLEMERGALEEKPTDSMEAYNAYLRGMEYARRIDFMRDDYEIAERMFERALSLDPEFAVASAELSIVHSKMHWAGYDHTEERLAKARASAERALELQPGLPEGHLAMGYHYYWGHFLYDEALREFATAKEGRPNDTRMIEAVALVERRRGHFEKAADLWRRVLELSPTDANVAGHIGDTYTKLRKYAAADSFYERSVSLAPDQALGYSMRANNLWLWKGDIQAARGWLERMPFQDDVYAFTSWYYLNLLERDYEAALEMVSSWDIDFEESVYYEVPPPLLAARTYDFMDEQDPARAMYDSARVMLEELQKDGAEGFEVHVCLGMVYAGLDRAEDAIREGKLAVELNPMSVDAYGAPFTIESLAEIYTMVGEYDAAIDQLDYLMSIPAEVSVHTLRLHPKWDPLRDHPRFQRLLEKYSESQTS